MDAKDRQILAALQEDGRLTNLELSERVALSPSPCLRRLRTLEKSGVIKGYTAIVDEQAYGLPLTVFVRIRLDRHSEEAVASFEQSIRGMDNILDCYVMTGDADYLRAGEGSGGLRAFRPLEAAPAEAYRLDRHQFRLWRGQAFEQFPEDLNYFINIPMRRKANLRTRAEPAIIRQSGNDRPNAAERKSAGAA